MEGGFEPSPPPQLLDRITDELIIVTSDVPWMLCAHRFNRRHRARRSSDCSPGLWPTHAARSCANGEAIGRDRRQAARPTSANALRADIAARAAWIQDARDRAHTRAILERSPNLHADLSSIDEIEREDLEKPAKEVYVGFHELESLQSSVPRPETPVCPPILAAT